MNALKFKFFGQKNRRSRVEERLKNSHLKPDTHEIDNKQSFESSDLPKSPSLIRMRPEHWIPLSPAESLNSCSSPSDSEDFLQILPGRQSVGIDKNISNYSGSSVSILPKPPLTSTLTRKKLASNPKKNIERLNTALKELTEGQEADLPHRKLSFISLGKLKEEDILLDEAIDQDEVYITTRKAMDMVMDTRLSEISNEGSVLSEEETDSELDSPVWGFQPRDSSGSRPGSRLHLYSPTGSTAKAIRLCDLKDSEKLDCGFFRSLTRAVYYDRLTKLLEKHKKGRWDSDFVNRKLKLNKGMYHQMYVRACEQYGEEPGPEFIPQSEHNVGTWDFDESSFQLCIYEFKPERYDWRMYSRVRVQDLFNIVESIRKMKQRLVLRFIDLGRIIYQPIKFTIVKERKVAVRKHGSVYRWKHKDKGEGKAEVTIVLYPYDKVLKLDWIHIKQFEMNGTQVMRLLMTLCDYLQFTMILNDCSAGTRASSIIRKGVSWYETLGFEYKRNVAQMFKRVLSDWDAIKMSTKGEQKSLVDSLQEKKFITSLFVLRGKRRCPNWMKEIQWGYKRHPNEPRKHSRRWHSNPDLSQSSKLKSEKISEISILEFTRRVYGTFSLCRSTEKERKSGRGFSAKEWEQMQSVKAHIEDVTNRMEAFLLHNPKTKKGFRQLYEKEHPMTRKCTQISETAFLTSIISKVEIPLKSETDPNTINSWEQAQNRRIGRAITLSQRMNRRKTKLMPRVEMIKSTSSPLPKPLHSRSLRNFDRPPLINERGSIIIGEEDSEELTLPLTDWKKPRLARLQSAPPSCCRFSDTDSESLMEHKRSSSQTYTNSKMTNSERTSMIKLSTMRIPPEGEVWTFRSKLEDLRARFSMCHEILHHELELFTPLMRSIIADRGEEVNRMLEEAVANPATLNHTDSEGRTALYMAIALGDADVVRRLLEAGASSKVLTESKMSPLTYAETYEEWKVVAELQKFEPHEELSDDYMAFASC